MTGRSFVVSMITVAAVLFIAGRCTAPRSCRRTAEAGGR
jgi:hypothetical protein